MRTSIPTAIAKFNSATASVRSASARPRLLDWAFTEQDIAFIGERDFLFLSTVDPRVHPTVSYKGGAPGFVQIDDNELVFPCSDGNGIFLSMGNI